MRSGGLAQVRRCRGGLFALLVAMGCSARPTQVALEAASQGAAPVQAAPRGAPSPAASAAAGVAGPGRLPVGEVHEATLPFTIEPVQGAGSVLFVSQFADERAAWVRRLDGQTQALGPLLALVDEHVYGAFDTGDGRFTLVTSDGARLCLATYPPGGETPEARGCAVVSPSAIVPVGDRLALIEVAGFHPEAPAAAPGKKEAARAAGASSGAALGRPKAQAKEQPRGREKKGAAKKGGRGKKKPARALAAAPPRPPRPVPVEVRIRWATRAGEIAKEATPSGLHFDAPLDGMALVDARPRPPGVDLLWFEAAPRKKTRAPLGRARLMAGALRADGSADLASRVAVVDADLDYGALHDHRAPRLVGTGAASAYVGLDGKGQCEAIRALPALARLTPTAALCAVDPDRLAASPPASPADVAALQKILEDAPRRAPGQPQRDPGLVAWAGDRAYFLRGGALRSASRADGIARDEPHPFVARRSRIAWGAVASDGEGIAFTGEGFVHLAAPGPGQAALVESRALGGAELPPLGRAADLPGDRRRAARIGATWWVARGDVVRVWPDAAAPPALRGAAPVDTAVLVGGAARGLLVEVAGEALRLRALDASGDAVPLGGPAVASPVRVGLDACERASGGALIAGVSAADASKVVAFAVDADGHVGRESPTPLPIRPGELAVRLTPLPGGGALLTDRERRHAVWLDDDARPLADAPAPLDESDALCLDGRPARASIPAPAPGTFVAIADLAAPSTCVVGEPTWTSRGALVWFGSATRGLDALAEARIVPSGLPLPAPPRTPSPVEQDPSRRPAATPVCPSDMVSVAGRFCVDRFEATLVDGKTGEPLSPDFPATPGILDFAFSEWSTARARTGGVHARAFPLPFLAQSRLGQRTEPLAVARLGARPNGYVTGVAAEAACAAAGKRLCSLDEFVTACRGEEDTLFPYGDAYEDGVCNVYREEHPAALLHDNASVGHLDPRLNRVRARGRPLFQSTGESPACRSRWGSDAAYDMNGNLDEWVDEGSGAFAGGFYARATRSGCEALVASHPRSYLDYSTGVRCCKDAAPRP